MRESRCAVEAGRFSPGEAQRRFRGARRPGFHRMGPRTVAAVLAASGALEEAGFAGIPEEGTDRVFLWVATDRGSEDADGAFWETAREEGGSLASPALFADTLPSALAGEVARALGLTGPAMVTAGRGAVEGAAAARDLAGSMGSAEVLLLLLDRGSGDPAIEALAFPLGAGRM